MMVGEKMEPRIQDEPLVSVIIPTFKRAKMLPRAIDSVLNQTYPNIQVVVIDDNNPETEWREHTEKLMKKYENNVMIKYIKHKKNSNGSVARNTGIQNADGEIVCFLDDDDFYYKDKVKKQVDFLLRNPSVHCVYCGWDRDGIIIPTKDGDCSFELLSGISLIYTNVIMMWKKYALKCGGWDESFQRHQEAAFMLRYFRLGEKIGLVKECLVKFDTSDRRNSAANGKINELQTEHYLNSYKDMIDRCEKLGLGRKKDIYSYRYRGVFLNYILEHDIKAALVLYFKVLKIMPIKFNLDLVRYTIIRIKGDK